MTTHVAGQAAAVTAAPTTLATGPQRRALLAVVIGCPLFSDAEQLRTNHNAHECACPAKLALWTRNAIRERDRREAADLARAEQAPAPGAPALVTPADAALFEAGIARFEAKLNGAPAPVAYATEAQCQEVARLAAKLPRQAQRDALRRLPALTEPEAAAFIRGLHLRQGPRLRVAVLLAGRPMQVLVAEKLYEAAKVDYVQELGTDQVRPAREVMWRGPLVRRVWAN